MGQQDPRVFSVFMNRCLADATTLFTNWPGEATNEFIKRLRIHKKAIAGLASAGILLGHSPSTHSIRLLFPEGQGQPFLKYLVEEEDYRVVDDGHRCVGEVCLSFSAVLVRGGWNEDPKRSFPRVRVEIFESVTSNALDVAIRFPYTCKDMFVGVGWFEVTFPHHFSRGKVERIRPSRYPEMCLMRIAHWRDLGFELLEPPRSEHASISNTTVQHNTWDPNRFNF